MADFSKWPFSKSPILKIFSRKFHRLVLGLVGLIDAKGIDVAQRIWLSFFESAIFKFFSKKNFFCSIPMKIGPNLYGRILMFSLVSRKFLTMRNIALYSVVSAETIRGNTVCTTQLVQILHSTIFSRSQKSY